MSLSNTAKAFIIIRRNSRRKLEGIADNIADCAIADNRHKYEEHMEEFHEQAQHYWELCRKTDKEL